MEQIKRKGLLYRSGVEYADFCLNHVEGCSHGCKFPCYAMQMAKRYGRVNSYSDWIKPKIVSNALELLEKEIPRYKDKIKFVHLCFMTDPFMYKNDEVKDMTLKIIETLNRNGIRCTILTKGIYPQELINTEKYSDKNEYGITLVSLNEQFKRKFEPFSSPYGERINSLNYLHKKGLSTWVSMEPYPTPNLITQDISKILHKLSFVDKIVFGKLNYNAETTNFEGSTAFYDNTADIVIRFCNNLNIEYHIKDGTKKTDNPYTKSIFKLDSLCKA